jgi:hypothetical protein
MVVGIVGIVGTGNREQRGGISVLCSVLQCVAVCCSVLQCVCGHHTLQLGLSSKGGGGKTGIRHLTLQHLCEKI